LRKRGAEFFEKLNRNFLVKKRVLIGSDQKKAGKGQHADKETTRRDLRRRTLQRRIGERRSLNPIEYEKRTQVLWGGGKL